MKEATMSSMRRFWLESKDAVLSYVIVALVFAVVQMFLATLIGRMMSDETVIILFFSSMGTSLLFGNGICALVLGCVSIQNFRFYNLAGRTRTIAYWKTAANNLFAIIVAILISIPFSISEEPYFILYHLLFIVMAYFLGFYLASITTVLSTPLSAVVIIASLLVLFNGSGFLIPHFVRRATHHLAAPVTTIMLIAILIVASYLLMTSKWSDLKTTSQN